MAANFNSVRVLALILIATAPFAQSRCPTDIIVIMDNSGSVQDVFEREKEIAAAMVNELDIVAGGTRVGYVEFNSHATTVFPFEQYATKFRVHNAILNLQAEGGGTNTADALKHANEDFQKSGRKDVNRIILMVTDGHSQNTVESLIDAMNELNKTGVTTYVATASYEPDLMEFGIYTYGNRDRQYMRNNVTQMPGIISRFIAGGGCLPQDTPGLALPVFQPKPKVDGCEVDLVVILDNSESVELVFVHEKGIIQEFLEGHDIEPGATRVSVIEYADHAHQKFGFEDFKTTNQAIDSVGEIAMVGGSTNTLDALNLAVQEFQTASRSTARKVLLLVTDGNSQNNFEDLKAAARRLHEMGVLVFAATASDDRDIGMYEFQAFVDGEYNNLFLKNNISALHKIAPENSLQCYPPAGMKAAVDSSLLGGGFQQGGKSEGGSVPQQGRSKSSEMGGKQKPPVPDKMSSESQPRQQQPTKPPQPAPSEQPKVPGPPSIMPPLSSLANRNQAPPPQDSSPLGGFTRVEEVTGDDDQRQAIRRHRNFRARRSLA